MLKTAVAIRHVHFEDLGTFESVLINEGYKVHYYDVGVHDLWTLDPIKTELLFILGAPVGVNEIEAYPFLADEIQLLKTRLAARRPTFGICLGAQLIATALGAKICPSAEKEIGFSPVILTNEGCNGPLKHLLGVPVLHWHGDTFDLPDQARRLASTSVCPNQAFDIGPNILGIQFHPEADVLNCFERWLIGHALELAASNLDTRTLRADALRGGSLLKEASSRLIKGWIKGLML